nr:MAG TPA: hypothetical protein [Caudoviricetes sp.]
MMTNILVSVWIMSQSYLLFKFFQRLASGDYYIAAFAGFSFILSTIVMFS